MAFTAIFERYGSKTTLKGYTETTLLLKQVCYANGQLATDHSWFTETAGFRAIKPLQKGDKITFEARITTYEKGHKGKYGHLLKPGSTDFKLNRPTQIKKLKQ